MATNQDNENNVNELEQEARHKALRENAKRIFRESGLAEMLQDINKNLLKGRGRFEEYDSMVLFKWGTAATTRHIWIEVQNSFIRFRLTEHLRCSRPAPICDGEYHTYSRSMWANRAFLQQELKKYYERPVTESSSD